MWARSSLKDFLWASSITVYWISALLPLRCCYFMWSSAWLLALCVSIWIQIHPDPSAGCQQDAWAHSDAPQLTGFTVKKKLWPDAQRLQTTWASNGLLWHAVFPMPRSAWHPPSHRLRIGFLKTVLHRFSFARRWHAAAPPPPRPVKWLWCLNSVEIPLKGSVTADHETALPPTHPCQDHLKKVHLSSLEEKGAKQPCDKDFILVHQISNKLYIF